MAKPSRLSAKTLTLIKALLPQQHSDTEIARLTGVIPETVRQVRESMHTDRESTVVDQETTDRNSMNSEVPLPFDTPKLQGGAELQEREQDESSRKENIVEKSGDALAGKSMETSATTEKTAISGLSKTEDIDRVHSEAIRDMWHKTRGFLRRKNTSLPESMREHIGTISEDPSNAVAQRILDMRSNLFQRVSGAYQPPGSGKAAVEGGFPYTTDNPWQLLPTPRPVRTQPVNVPTRESGVRVPDASGDGDETRRMLFPEEASIRGRAGDVLVILNNATHQLGHDPQQWMQFLSTVLPATIQRLERERLGTRVMRTDAVLVALRRMPDVLVQHLGFPLAPWLRSYIEQERVINDDWLATLGSIGDTFSNGDQDALVLLRGITLWHELELLLLDEWKDPANLTDSDVPSGVLRLAAINCHNIAAQIARIDQNRQRDERGPDRRMYDVIRKLTRVSLAFSIKTAAVADKEVMHSIFQVLGLNGGTSKGSGKEKFDPRLAVLIDQLAQVPRAIALDDRPLAVSYLEASAAMARTVIKDRDIRTSAALFNSGVRLVAVRREGPTEKRLPSSRLRLLLNSLGLWWALRNDEPDVPRALGPGDGLDCCVNLFGAADDIGRSQLQEDHLLNLLVSLAKAVAAFVHSGQGSVTETDAARMENVWRSLGIGDASRGAAMPDYKSWLGLSREIVMRTAASLRYHESVPESSDGAALWSCHAIRTAYDNVYTEEMPEILDDVRQLLLGHLKDADEGVVKLFAGTYREFAEQSPAVAAGVVDESEWNAEWSTATRSIRREPCDNLTDAWYRVLVDLAQTIGEAGGLSSTAR